LTNSIFGRSELHRKFMRQRHGAVAVFIRYRGRFSDLRHDGLSGLIRRIAGLLLWWKFYDVFGYLGPILTHRGPPSIADSEVKPPVVPG
jgi:hypothetical protein